MNTIAWAIVAAGVILADALAEPEYRKASGPGYGICFISAIGLMIYCMVKP